MSLKLPAAAAPMSFAQERLWLSHVADPESPAYHVPLLTRWHGQVDPDALAVALCHVVARHEVLRTTYSLLDNGPAQIVNEPEPIAVETIGVDAATDIDAEIDSRVRQPFDLAAGPLLRCTVWSGHADGDLVLIVVHHIAIDGWSLATFYGDLATAYRAALRGVRPELPASSVHYSDFARWDRDTFATADRQKQLSARVADLLDSGEALTLTGAHPEAAALLSRRPGEQQTFQLSAAEWTGVRDLAGRLRATPFVVLNAIFQATLHQWSGHAEFILGVVTAARPHPDFESLVGFFVNTVPIRCCVSPGDTFQQLCIRARAEAYRALTYQWIPFDRLTSELASARADGHRQLVNVCFAFQNMPPIRVEPPLWEPVSVLPTGAAKFDLLLVIEEAKDGAIGTVEFDTGRYAVEVCNGVIATYLDLLRKVIADPDTPVFHAPAQDARPSVSRQQVDITRPVPAKATIDLAVELFSEALSTIGRNSGIGPTSNFFALGGHSLLAVTMLAQASHRHGIIVRPKDFLAEPTVARLAGLLATEASGPDEKLYADGSRPATSAQARFWFLDRITALRAAYLMPTVIELRGHVDPSALAAAVDQVVAHHPALRSRFTLNRKERRVFYRTDGPPATAVITDARGWASEHLRKHVAELCWTGFDLAREAPARAELVSAGSGHALLVLTLHHIAADGRSLRLLLDQIAQCFRARTAGIDPLLPAAIAPDAQERDTDGSQAAEVIAWLADAPVDVALPHDRPRPQVQSIDAASMSLAFDTELTARLRARATASATTIFAPIAAVLAVALARRSGQRDFVFAFPWGARDPDPATSGSAVSMQVNTLALRVDLRDLATWADLLGRVRDSLAVSYRNADASYDSVVAKLHPDRGLSRPPLTPVYLAIQDEQPVPDFGDGTTARYLPLDPLLIKYELELTVTDHGDTVGLEIAYATALFDAGTIAGLAADLVAAASDLACKADLDVTRGKVEL